MILKYLFKDMQGLFQDLSTWIGGVKAYGKTSNEAFQLYKNIKDIEATGAWGIELECVPEDLVEEIIF
jgi:3-methyl-2-oxobutanoate hydroxymethyltransferase